MDAESKRERHHDTSSLLVSAVKAIQTSAKSTRVLKAAGRQAEPAESPARSLKPSLESPGRSPKPSHFPQAASHHAQASSQNAEVISSDEVRLELERFLQGGFQLALDNLRHDIHKDMLAVWNSRDPPRNHHESGSRRKTHALRQSVFMGEGPLTQRHGVRNSVFLGEGSATQRHGLHGLRNTVYMQEGSHGQRRLSAVAESSSHAADEYFDTALHIDQIASLHRAEIQEEHEQETIVTPKPKVGWADEQIVRKMDSMEDSKIRKPEDSAVCPPNDTPKALKNDAPSLLEDPPPRLSDNVSLVEEFSADDHNLERDEILESVHVSEKTERVSTSTDMTVLTEGVVPGWKSRQLGQSKKSRESDRFGKILGCVSGVDLSETRQVRGGKLGLATVGRMKTCDPTLQPFQYTDRLPVGLFSFQTFCTHAKLRKLVSSYYFDFASGFITALSAVWIGIQADCLARNDTDELPSSMIVGELIFCCLFTGELALRLAAYGPWIFVRAGWSWAIFDCVVVILQIVDFISVYVNNSTQGELDMSFARLMRILRLVRVVRVLRIVRFLSELRTIVISILGSMRSLLWTMMLLLILIYIVGIYFTQLVNDHVIKNREWLVPAERDMKVRYRNLARSMLTLFQAMSGGLDWDTCAGPLIDHISWIQGIIFSVYIAATVLALMNVVTGVFVEEALKSAKKEDTACMAEDLCKFFKRGDKDGVGALPSKLFLQLCTGQDFVEYIESIDVDPDEALALYHLMSLGGNGNINYVEYVNGCLRLRTNAKAIDILSVLHGTRVMSRNLTEKFADMECLLEEVLYHLVDIEEEMDPGHSQNSGNMAIDSPRQSFEIGLPQELQSAGSSKLPSLVEDDERMEVDEFADDEH